MYSSLTTLFLRIHVTYRYRSLLAFDLCSDGECDTLYIMTFFIRRSVQPVRHSMHTSVLFDVDPLLDQPPPFLSLSLLSGSLRTSFLLDVCLLLHIVGPL